MHSTMHLFENHRTWTWTTNRIYISRQTSVPFWWLHCFERIWKYEQNDWFVWSTKNIPLVSENWNKLQWFCLNAVQIVECAKRNKDANQRNSVESECERERESKSKRDANDGEPLWQRGRELCKEEKKRVRVILARMENSRKKNAGGIIQRYFPYMQVNFIHYENTKWHTNCEMHSERMPSETQLERTHFFCSPNQRTPYCRQKTKKKRNNK